MSLYALLKQSLKHHHRFLTGTLSHNDSPIYVIGNPSADLDSIISAIVYAYFAGNSTPRRHIPLINLPNVHSGPELYRLRPEFVKALWLSTSSAIEGNPGQQWAETPESAGEVLREHFLTVADFAKHLQDNKGGTTTRLQADAVLVDWNALPISHSQGEKGTLARGSLTGLENVDFTVLGCIDHHIDEGFIPHTPETQPLQIATAGSCSSLVVRALNDMKLWTSTPTPTPTSPNNANAGNSTSNNTPPSIPSLARLALAPLLIDTANLTASDKVTPFDKEAYAFLTSQLQSQSQSQPQHLDPTTLYTQVSSTKTNSLDLLTIDEILDRDYKQWTETTTQTQAQAQKPIPIPVTIGFSSTVKSIPWIVSKAGSPQDFLDAVYRFAKARELGIIVVMTAFSSPLKMKMKKEEGDKFTRELFVCALDGVEGVGKRALEGFVRDAVGKLRLEEWVALDYVGGSEDGDGSGSGQEEKAIKDALSSDAEPFRRIWVQMDLSKSRKQVAPLLRGCVASL